MPLKTKLFFISALFSVFVTAAAGCGYEPDTSAPERIEIERVADWRGALLYYADENGPTPGWGSVRSYDNVSGLVERTVEQAKAAQPVDVFITREGSAMYIAGGNGIIDKFRFDGNNWNKGEADIETPAMSLAALREGPDGRLYALEGAGGGGPATILIIQPGPDSLAAEPLTFPALRQARGIAWSPDGGTVYLSGFSSVDSRSVLLAASWPAAQVLWTVDLPLEAVNQAVVSTDGNSVYVMGSGGVLVVDTATRTVKVTFDPSSTGVVDFADADLSADGAFMFVTGSPPQGNSSIYVIDLASLATVKMAENVGSRALGIQRVE